MRQFISSGGLWGVADYLNMDSATYALAVSAICRCHLVRKSRDGLRLPTHPCSARSSSDGTDLTYCSEVEFGLSP